MKDDISIKSRSVSGTSSSGESVVLHTPVDDISMYKTAIAEDHGHNQGCPPLLDHVSRLHTADMAEVGYNLDYLTASQTPQAIRQRETDRRIVTNGSDFPRKPSYGNCVIRFKRSTRKFWAEFFGTAILVLFGTAVNNQVALGGSTLVSSTPTGSFVSVAFGWGLAVMLGVVLSAGLSGGHLNPAVTLALAIFRGFSWAMVPLYWLAQFTGATFGAALELLACDQPRRGWFWDTNNKWDRGLIFHYLAVGDNGNVAPVKGLGPFFILWVVFGLASSLGMQTSFALNPARDIGPRILTWLAGYGNSVWTFRSCYFLTVATLGPIFGAIIGCIIYDLFLGTEEVPDCLLHGHSRSPYNWRKIQPSTTVADPEKYLTQLNKKRSAGAGLSRMKQVNTGKTSSHRYVSLNAA
ncbi:aquaporin-like protein [Melampsora americana]|nr:aquaporin-like protein [Melampsora americana]